MLFESTSLVFLIRINTLSLTQKALKVDKDSVIFVYANGFIHAIASIDGEIIWKKELASEGLAFF